MGCTLADLRAGRLPVNSAAKRDVVLNDLSKTNGVDDFIREVQSHLRRCSDRQAVRNQHQPFLPTAQAGDAFGVPFVYSTLQRRLQAMGKFKAGGDQWLKTIENFQKNGVRAEEFEFAELVPDLWVLDDEQGQMSAGDLAGLCNFTDLRLSVIPVISTAQKQIRFAQPPERALKRTKKLPKAQAGQTRDVAGFDPVLGYRIEQVVHQTLWGSKSHWQAVLYDGAVLRNVWEQSLFSTSEAATELAALHAKQNFPKRLALGRFGRFAWSGGKDYREWLITLPYYPTSYLSGHFDVRNVLAHVRCDIREGVDGERVLMLHDAPTVPMGRGRSLARMLGFDVAFIESHKDFDGVSYEGIAAVSPSEKYPEVGIIGHEVLHSLKKTNPGVVQKVTYLGNTGNVNFGWFAYGSTDGHPKKCYPILNHARFSVPYLASYG